MQKGDRACIQLAFRLDDPIESAVYKEICKAGGRSKSKFVVQCIAQQMEQDLLAQKIADAVEERLKGLMQEGTAKRKRGRPPKSQEFEVPKTKTLSPSTNQRRTKSAVKHNDSSLETEKQDTPQMPLSTVMIDTEMLASMEHFISQ